MSDRYTTLLSVKNPRWSVNSPIVIEKGALLKDSITNNNLLHFQIRNIGTKVIVALNISIDCIDVIDHLVSEKVDYSYLDLNVKGNDSFGNNVPILLNELGSREFIVTINKIIFEDGSKLEPYTVLHEIALPQSINILGDLKNQFLANVAKVISAIKVTTLPQKHKDYWYCVCGALNLTADKNCRVCGCNIETLIELSNMEGLKTSHEKAENIRIEAKKVEQNGANIRRKKTIIIVGVVLLLITSALILSMTVPTYAAYKDAQKLIVKGDFDKVVQILSGIEDFRDSKDLINEAKYQKALHAFKQGFFDDAYYGFNNLAEYKDSANMASECNYQTALSYINNKKYYLALPIFTELRGYKDSEDKIMEISEILKTISIKPDPAIEPMTTATDAPKTITADVPKIKVEEPEPDYFISATPMSANIHCDEVATFTINHNAPDNRIWLGSGEDSVGMMAGHDWGDKVSTFTISRESGGVITVYFYYFVGGKKIRTDNIIITISE